MLSNRKCVLRAPLAYPDTPTIAEVSCSLSLRGTSGERKSTADLVVVSRRARAPQAVTLSAVLQKKPTRADHSTVPARTSRLYALLCSGSCALRRSTSALLGLWEAG